MLIVRVMARGGTGFEYVTDLHLEDLHNLFYNETTEWIHIPGKTDMGDPVMQSVLRSEIISVIIFPRVESKITVPSPRLVQ